MYDCFVNGCNLYTSRHVFGSDFLTSYEQAYQLFMRFLFFKGSCFRGVVCLCSHAVLVVLYNLEGLVLWPRGLSAVTRTGLF